ncbi:ribosome recycling factor [uncultured Dialister sp.]|jgi:ribosome recycling factor|uniref:ribosome recycling factor n=1 Tax=Dialister sp. TaxID=1955814 RepID=UPI0025F95D9E|nr:ribosome recycling factor [uncultured Dialister sp.]
MYEDELKTLSEKMDKSINALRNEFTSIRTGQANASLLDRVFVEYYGTRTPVTQVASVTVPEARMLVVQPWDKSLLKDIEKAILQSDLGLVPMNDGNLIRMAIPQLTEERRKELVKIVNKKSEEAKVAVRNIRRDGNIFLKKEEKNSDVSKDVIKDTEDKIQKLTDKKIKEVEAVTDKKIKEIMSV